jgi:hypothetical protein
MMAACVPFILAAFALVAWNPGSTVRRVSR